MSCNTALNKQNKNTFKPSSRGSTNYFSGMCSLLQIPSREHPQLCCDGLRGRGFHPTWERNPVLEPCVEPELCCLVKAALRCSGPQNESTTGTIWQTRASACHLRVMLSILSFLCSSVQVSISLTHSQAFFFLVTIVKENSASFLVSFSQP